MVDKHSICVAEPSRLSGDQRRDGRAVLLGLFREEAAPEEPYDPAVDGESLNKAKS